MEYIGNRIEVELVLGGLMRLMNFEHAVEHGNLDEAKNFFVDVLKHNLTAVLLHFSICNEKSTQSAAVAEFNFIEVNIQRFHFRLAENEKFSLQLG